MALSQTHLAHSLGALLPRLQIPMPPHLPRRGKSRHSTTFLTLMCCSKARSCPSRHVMVFFSAPPFQLTEGMRQELEASLLSIRLLPSDSKSDLTRSD